MIDWVAEETGPVVVGWGKRRRRGEGSSSLLPMRHFILRNRQEKYKTFSSKSAAVERARLHRFGHVRLVRTGDAVVWFRMTQKRRNDF